MPAPNSRQAEPHPTAAPAATQHQTIGGLWCIHLHSQRLSQLSAVTGVPHVYTDLEQENMGTPSSSVAHPAFHQHTDPHGNPAQGYHTAYLYRHDHCLQALCGCTCLHCWLQLLLLLHSVHIRMNPVRTAHTVQSNWIELNLWAECVSNPAAAPGCGILQQSCNCAILL
jgi:hypothetical protein